MDYSCKCLGPRGLSCHFIYTLLVSPLDVYSRLLLRMYGTTECGFDWKLYFRLMHLDSVQLNFVFNTPSVFSSDGEFYVLHF